MNTAPKIDLAEINRQVNYRVGLFLIGGLLLLITFMLLR